MIQHAIDATEKLLWALILLSAAGMFAAIGHRAGGHCGHQHQVEVVEK